MCAKLDKVKTNLSQTVFFIYNIFSVPPQKSVINSILQGSNEKFQIFMNSILFILFMYHQIYFQMKKFTDEILSYYDINILPNFW